MSTGERGPVGDHGQAGDVGQTGARGRKGDKGEKGASGVTPWVVRQANLAYILLAAGLFGFVLVSQWQERQNDEQDAKVLARFEAQVIANDRDACVKANESRGEVNRNRDAIRALEASVRSSYELVVSPPDATDVQRQRTNEFRTKILALLDQVKVDGNLEMRDCSAIGNGRTNFSEQNPVTELTTTTTPNRP